MYRDALLKDFADTSKLVALCDINEGRLKLSLETVRDRDGIELAGYKAEDFEKMISETKPDCVIVTTKDCTHDHYICRAMEMGCDVITEKPMTTDEKKCQRILDTKKKTGKKCTVTFNYRYSPPRAQVKELLMSGVIGEVLSVDFHWMLDTHHGADYFRRWHRHKSNSGGLIVHKATHHFDLVNWWLSTVPETVYAAGHRRFYISKIAERCGLTNRKERCLICPEKGKCPFYLDLKQEYEYLSQGLRRMYLDCEKYDGYYRDQCVFSDKIDIEDSMNVTVSYATGAKMSYSLNAFSPWEGYLVVFNGTKGRIEHKCEETVYINGDGSVPGELKKEGIWTKVYPHWSPAYAVDVWQGEGSHGGGDKILLQDLFSSNPPKDKFMKAADYRAGAWSILTGIAANHSMLGKRAIKISDLVSGLEMPDYPPMPNGNEPIPLPKKQQKQPQGYEESIDAQNSDNYQT
jgi:predicted dehydrogenase